MKAMESAIPEGWKTRGESLSVEEALDKTEDILSRCRSSC